MNSKISYSFEGTALSTAMVFLLKGRFIAQEIKVDRETRVRIFTGKTWSDPGSVFLTFYTERFAVHNQTARLCDLELHLLRTDSSFLCYLFFFSLKAGFTHFHILHYQCAILLLVKSCRRDFLYMCCLENALPELCLQFWAKLLIDLYWGDQTNGVQNILLGHRLKGLTMRRETWANLEQICSNRGIKREEDWRIL